MTLNDGVRYRLGTYPLESDVLRMTPIKVRQDESLPETFDARDKWPNKLQPIRDQGNCGSSWAFSTTGNHAFRLASLQPRLSLGLCVTTPLVWPLCNHAFRLASL